VKRKRKSSNQGSNIQPLRRYPRLAKLSTDGYVATDGAKALLDSCIQPNGPQGAQPENLDVATSSMADLPHLERPILLLKNNPPGPLNKPYSFNTNS
jgi:hypothetical protein